jgi:prepilin-type N-terminal cleavage/methylation domain-containing protein
MNYQRKRTGRRHRAFTLIEMMVSVSIFAMIFGLAGMLYVQSTWRAANAMETNKLVGEVRDLDRFLETTFQNATNVQSVYRGLPLLSATAIECTMPANGSTYDQFGLYNSYTPSSCTNGAVHWGTGKLRYLYFSDSTGAYANSGSTFCVSEVSSGAPTSYFAPFTYLYSNTNINNWYLIDSVTFTINSANNTVTYVIHATDLTQTGQALGTSADTADSHTLQLTRTVYWRHSVT